MEFNPIYTVNDFVQRFKAYSPKLWKKCDDNYDWLADEADVCIEIINPDPDASIKNIIIHCENEGEFTLYYCGHTHFSPYEEDFERLCRMTSDILNSEIGSETVYGGEDGRWLCFSFTRREEIEDSIWECAEVLTDEEIDSMLRYQFEKDVLKKLRAFGGRVEYRFWNSAYNKTVNIDNANDEE